MRVALLALLLAAGVRAYVCHGECPGATMPSGPVARVDSECLAECDGYACQLKCVMPGECVQACREDAMRTECESKCKQCIHGCSIDTFDARDDEEQRRRDAARVACELNCVEYAPCPSNQIYIYRPFDQIQPMPMPHSKGRAPPDALGCVPLSALRGEKSETTIDCMVYVERAGIEEKRINRECSADEIWVRRYSRFVSPHNHQGWHANRDPPGCIRFTALRGEKSETTVVGRVYVEMSGIDGYRNSHD